MVKKASSFSESVEVQPTIHNTRNVTKKMSLDQMSLFKTNGDAISGLSTDEDMKIILCHD